MAGTMRLSGCIAVFVAFLCASCAQKSEPPAAPVAGAEFDLPKGRDEEPAHPFAALAALKKPK